MVDQDEKYYFLPRPSIRLVFESSCRSGWFLNLLVDQAGF